MEIYENAKQNSDIQRITPFIWFDDNAEEAARFYTSVFNNSSIDLKSFYTEASSYASQQPIGSLMTITFHLEGQEFVGINGGPIFHMNPSISFFVNCGTREEIDKLWNKLSKEGEILMELDKYPFSERYGWVKDRFGITWQLTLVSGRQKIIPCLMFTGNMTGRAEEAMNFYSSIFMNSGVIHMEKYAENESNAGNLKHCRFFLDNEEFMVMDSNADHTFNFTPALSLVVNCRNQSEIDYFWDNLSEGGDEGAQICGWLQDKFGVSWQIIPSIQIELISKSDEETVDRLMREVMMMKKIDMGTLMRVESYKY